MFINKVEIDGKEYRLFGDVVLFPKTKKEIVIDYIAEEKLDSEIVRRIKAGQYQSVKSIDEMYGYFVPQDIADTEDENEIRRSVEDAFQ